MDWITYACVFLTFADVTRHYSYWGHAPERQFVGDTHQSVHVPVYFDVSLQFPAIAE